MTSVLDLKSALNFAQNLAQSVGEKLLAMQNNVSVVAFKERQDMVTTADYAAEKLYLKAIHHQYPDHSIHSEEQGSDQKKSDYQWIIDPLDGTKEYLRGIPLWNTNLTLELHRRPILSVIYKPDLKVLFAATKVVGVLENGRQTKLSTIKSLSQSHIYAYLPSQASVFQPLAKPWQKMAQLSQQTYRLRGSSEEVVSIAWVAIGKIEAAVNFCRFPQWYDFASGLVCAQTAGCRVTDLNNQPIDSRGQYQGYIISNGLIHQAIIDSITA
ncbi:hypothetical protein A2W24_02135 [Microgenomates group bacterium RBG_16_45_19]|nr:MAG: hypothetical protein A2W24_02135 [Microgenomates group bacterium RBG_16_45_19]